MPRQPHADPPRHADLALAAALRSLAGALADLGRTPPATPPADPMTFASAISDARKLADQAEPLAAAEAAAWGCPPNAVRAPYQYARCLESILAAAEDAALAHGLATSSPLSRRLRHAIADVRARLPHLPSP